MARRHFESGLTKGDALTQPEMVAQWLKLQLTHTDREVFGLLLLDQQNLVIRFEPLFYGTLNEANVYPREVIKTALEYQAAAVIFVHNHPSGDPTPSRADIELTHHLCQALTFIDIRCLDHMILGDKGRWASLAQLGKMPNS